MSEEYKNIPGYNWLYQASNYGNIRSLHFDKERILKPANKRYSYVALCKNWKLKSYKVHRLIMLTFVGASELQVNHKNWDKYDNRLINLEYVTQKENIRHKFEVLGQKWSVTWHFGKLHHNSKKVYQLNLSWKLIKTWYCTMDIKRELWYNQWNINSCCKWRKQTAHGYKWTYSI